MSVNNLQNDPNQKLTTTTALEAAVRDNRLEQIENSLCKYGLPKRGGSKTTNYSVLLMAIEQKKTEIAEQLINAGCRVNAKDTDTGYTPLALAVLIESAKIATLLLEKGAYWDAGNSSGLTVLYLAAQKGSLKMIKCLLRTQISIDHVSNGQTPFQVFLENCKNIHEYENTEIVRQFLINGASMNFKTSDGQNVMHHIAKCRKVDIIKYVLKASNSVNEQCDSKNTALHNFLNDSNDTEENIVEVVTWFLWKGTKITIQNNLGDTAFHLAAKKKHLRVLKFFLQCQWNVDCCNREGNTVLHCILVDSENLYNNACYLQIVYAILKQSFSKLVKNNEGKTLLHIAADNKQRQILKSMLWKPADINAIDKNGNTVLYTFIKNLLDDKIVPCKRDIGIVKKMIAIGTNPSTCHHRSRDSPVHLALQLKNKEIILLMLESNFNFEKFDVVRERSMLYFLCNDKLDSTETEQLLNAEIAEICIEKGATVDYCPDSKTPLYMAVLMRQKHMVKTLLRYGADPNLLDNEGRTILENLMKKKVCVEVDAKDDHGAYTHRFLVLKEIPEDIKRDSEIARMLLSKGAVAEKISKDQVSIFHYCAANQHLNMLQDVIPYCKNADVRDSHKNTILKALLTYNLNTNEEVEKTVAEVVAVLLSKGAKVTTKNEQGETPLHLAAKGKHLEASKALLHKEASVTDSDDHGNSVLHFLCMLQSETNDSVEEGLTNLFVNKGCNISTRNNKGMTPILFAAQSGSVNMIRILRKLGAKLDCVEDENQSMPIHLAAEKNHQEVIELLISYGVDVNARKKDRKTPLHLSVAHNLSNTTRLLLEGGAHSDLKDSEGKTPLHWACWYESLDNINEVVDYGADVNVEDKFQLTPLMLTTKSGDARTKLRYLLVKLRAVGVHVSSCNACHIEESNVEYTNYSNASEMKAFESTVTEEILRMKDVQITARTTLADVLSMSADKLSVFKCNEDFRKFLNSDDFREKFPIYADLIRASYRKGIVRGDLTMLAKDSFRQILGFALPETCCDAIFHYLNNENLHNLEKAAHMGITKPKRFFDEICEDVPAKRIRRISF